MKFVFVSFLFLVDDFDLSVSLVTRNRADQPIRPSACAKQYQERTHCAARGRLRYGTLVVLLSGVRRGPTRRSAIAIPISFDPTQQRICLAPREQHSAPGWGSAPGFVGSQTTSPLKARFTSVWD